MKKWCCTLLLIVISISVFSLEPITNYRALFSPHDHLAEELISLIDKERKTIRIAVYCLTHRQIVKALTHAKERGVDVQVLIDPDSLRSKTVLRQMQKPPFPILVWNPPLQYKELKNGKRVQKRRSLLHDKFCVFGNDRVWTGSFNFTLDGSNTHQENALIIESRELAKQYLADFERLKMESTVSLTSFLTQLK